MHAQFDDGSLSVKKDEHLNPLTSLEFSKTWVGSFMIWWSPYCEVTNSIFASSVVVLSLIYQILNFSTTIKCELESARVSRVSSKLAVNFLKPSLVWLGGR